MAPVSVSAADVSSGYCLTDSMRSVVSAECDMKYTWTLRQLFEFVNHVSLDLVKRRENIVSFVLSMEPNFGPSGVCWWEASVESVPLLLNSKILAGIQKGSGMGTFARAHDLRLKSLRFTGSQKDHFMVAEHAFLF